MTPTMSSTPSRTLTRTALGVMASAALLAGAVASPLAAHAQAAGAASSAIPPRADSGHRVVHRDARRDVVHFDTETQERRPAPRDRSTDIVRTVVDHRTARTVVQARTRQLERSAYRMMIVEILTSGDRRLELVVDYARTPIDARISLRRFATGRDVPCPGASWSLTWSTKQVGVSVPNSCLGDPRWIRVGVATIAAPFDLTTSRADDSRTRGRLPDRHLTLGPRQPRA